MSFKAVNDTAGPDGIVPTLLVFGAYPRMTQWDAPAASIAARAKAVEQAMEAVRQCHATRKVTEALRIRNGPRTSHLAELPVNSDVLVWREEKGWQGPYQLLAMDGETAQIQLPNGPRSFRSTAVKPFYEDPEQVDAQRENLPGVTTEPAPSAAPGS